MTETAIVLLAAGSSRRMGQPKQLLDFQGKKLIQIVVERLLACRAFPTVIVLGAQAEAIAQTLDYPDLNIIQNPNWATGMASTIACALEFLDFHFPQVDHILFALVDQPYVEAEHYYALLEKSEQFPNKIIAAQYADTIGPPMIFPRSYFLQLQRLIGDQGAANIARAALEDVVVVPMPTAAVDWDFLTDVVG
jgi:CTP:molybdopterin cytidylyltransferase MocA